MKYKTGRPSHLIDTVLKATEKERKPAGSRKSVKAMADVLGASQTAAEPHVQPTERRTPKLLAPLQSIPRNGGQINTFR